MWGSRAAVRDREINAAKNIFAAGRGCLAGKNPACCGAGSLILPAPSVAAAAKDEEDINYGNRA